jgi:taurine dioxygenase
MNVRPLHPLFGAEVTGLDLSRDVQTYARELRRIFLDRSVLVIRNQTLSEAQFVALAKAFGPIEPYESTVGQFLMKDHPDVLVLSNIVRNGQPIGIRDAGQYWHTDRSYVENPAWASLLHPIVLPVDSLGVTRGSTQFTSTLAAFDALDEPMKGRLRPLRAVHHYIYRYTAAPENRLPDASHPIALRHPYNGRESLYVNKGFTSHVEGLSEDDSRDLLQTLYAHVAQPERTYTHDWRPGDLLLWDNFATQHNAIRDYELPLERLMWRTTMRAPLEFA